MHMELNKGRQLHSLLSLLPSQPLQMKPIQMPHIKQFDRAPLSQETFRLPTERLNTPDKESPKEEIVSIIGPDTPAVVMDSAVDILRIQQVEATTKTLAQTSESIIPPRIPDNITISHVNLSAPGYEPVSLKSSVMGPPPTRTQVTSVIPQLDGPRSLPTVNPTQEKMGRLPD